MSITGPRILGKLLVENEGVCPDDLEAALGVARRGRERIGETLVRQGVTTSEPGARALGPQLGLEGAAPPL